MSIVENSAAIQVAKFQSSVSAGGTNVLSVDALQVPAGYRALIMAISAQVNFTGSGIGWDAGSIRAFACDSTYGFGTVPLQNDGAGNFKLNTSQVGVMIGTVIPIAGVGIETIMPLQNGYPFVLEENWFLRTATDTVPGVNGEIYELEIAYQLIPKC